MKKTKEQLNDYLDASLDQPGAIAYTIITAGVAVFFLLFDLIEKRPSFQAVFAFAALVAAIPLCIWYSMVKKGRIRCISYSYLLSGLQYLVVFAELILVIHWIFPAENWSPLSWVYFAGGFLFSGTATIIMCINFRRWEQDKPQLRPTWLVALLLVPLAPFIYVFFRYGRRNAWRNGLKDDSLAQSFVIGGGLYLLITLALTGAAIQFVRFAAAQRHGLDKE